MSSLICTPHGSSSALMIETGSTSPMTRRSGEFGRNNILSTVLSREFSIKPCSSSETPINKFDQNKKQASKPFSNGPCYGPTNGTTECLKITVEQLLVKLNSLSSLSPVIIDLRESRLFQTSHISNARSANCYTKTMAKRAIATWSKWFPENPSHLEIVVYDSKSEGPGKLASLSCYLKYLNGLGHTVFFLQGGLDRFKRISENRFVESCLSPDTIQQYQCSPTNVENSSEDVLNAAASKILPFLYLGNERDAHDTDVLESLGITHILNVTATVSFYHATNNKYRYHRLSATDCQSQDLRKFFDEAFLFIDDAKNNKGNVLIHCWAGVSRSATIVMAYLMKNSKLNILQILDYVRSRRSVVAPNFNFMGQLERFHADLDSGKADRSDYLTPILLAEVLSSSSSGYNTSEASLSSEGDGSPPTSLILAGSTVKAIPFLK